MSYVAIKRNLRLDALARLELPPRIIRRRVSVPEIRMEIDRIEAEQLEVQNQQNGVVVPVNIARMFAIVPDYLLTLSRFDHLVLFQNIRERIPVLPRRRNSIAAIEMIEVGRLNAQEIVERRFGNILGDQPMV